ncbi:MULTISPECIES: hypothetical protein [unclassified Streptomyces]|uniref:hypothetical protein n=1 Tax=unclassified Streptomyces TaxID=2593676 RepID=UPI0036FBEFD9
MENRVTDVQAHHLMRMTRRSRPHARCLHVTCTTRGTTPSDRRALRGTVAALM